MKLLFDLFPVILFFATYKVGEAHKETAALYGSSFLGWLVSDGVVSANDAPILWATSVAIVATVLQVLYVLARGRRVDAMLWVSLGIITVFGGATIWLHNDIFIKWKPTVLYWLFASVLVFSQAVLRKNLIRSMMQEQLDLPDPLWRRLNLAWIGFFSIMGVINLYVAYNYPRDTWVSFKLFGFMGLLLAFVVGQALVLSRYVKEEAPADDAAAAEKTS